MKVTTNNVRRDINLQGIDVAKSECTIIEPDGATYTKKIKSVIIEFED